MGLLAGKFYTADPDYFLHGWTGNYLDGNTFTGQIRIDQLPPGTSFNTRHTFLDSKAYCYRIRGELTVETDKARFRQDGEVQEIIIHYSHFPPDGLDFIQEDSNSHKAFRGTYKPVR